MKKQRKVPPPVRNPVALANTEARYDRQKRLALGPAVCDVCGTQRTCLVFDHSDGEYGECTICRPCALNAFDD